jgi:hypothetical protein
VNRAAMVRARRPMSIGVSSESPRDLATMIEDDLSADIGEPEGAA